MMLERNIKDVIKTIEGYYKNMQLATYSINTEEKCVDIALYDDIRKSDTIGRYFASHSFRSTEITMPDITDKQLQKIKKALERNGIKENEVYKPYLNEHIYNLGDVVLYENDSYGKIIDIDRDSEYCYAMVFPDIYTDDRPYWVADDEIEPVTNQAEIDKINTWYESEKEQIAKDIAELNSEEMECD